VKRATGRRRVAEALPFMVERVLSAAMRAARNDTAWSTAGPKFYLSIKELKRGCDG
jgi:hypothetical protein